MLPPHFSPLMSGSNWAISALALKTYGGADSTGPARKCTLPSIRGLGHRRAFASAVDEDRARQPDRLGR
jgi:hypothetical protein